MPLNLKSSGGGSVSITPAATVVDVNITVPATAGTLATAEGLAASSGASLVGYLPTGTGAIANSVQNKLRESVSIVDKGGDNTGIVSCSSIIELLAADGKAIYFPAGTYKVATEVTLPSNTILYAHRDATIVSTIPTIVSNYQPIFKTSAARSNIAIVGLKFQTANTEQAVLSTLFSIDNLRLIDNECQGCGLIRLFDGGRNVWIDNNYIHSSTTSGVFNDYARAIKVSSVWAGTSSYNIHITNNTIYGNWTHGIEVYGGVITDQQDPTVAKKISGVTVSNNIVRATAGNTTTAGAIWFSQVADVTVTGNTCESYWDVGIDFEACTNAVAYGNTLRNNNKNLALYGNNLNVRFTGNVCTNTVVGLTQVWNTYANTYSVDTRNRDIVFSSNTFASVATSATGAEQIILGTAGRITFTGNKLYNCWIVGTYDSLQEAVITDNDMFFDYFSSGTNLQFQINIAQVIKSTDPFYGVAGGLYCTIQRNRIRMNNVNSGVYPIRWRMNDVTTGTISYNYTIIISDNEISQNAPVTAQSISVEFVTTSVLTGYYQSVQIKRNQVPSPILLTVPSVAFMRPTIQIADNTSQTGLPYTESRSTAGALTRYATNILTTAGSGITWTLADGQYVGQQCLIQLGTFGGGTATVTVVNHDLGINQNGTLTAAGQFFLLVWHGTQWSTIKSTGTGL